MADWPVSTPTAAAILAAVTSATWGDSVTLTAGVVYVGTVTLPAKPGYTGTPVTIRSTPHASLPATGTRINPAVQGPLLAKVQPVQNSGSQNLGCIDTEPGAEGYVIQHLEFQQSFTGPGTMVKIGNQDPLFFRRSHQPNAITIRACHFNANSTNSRWGTRRGAGLHGTNITLRDCVFSNIGSPTSATDSQCVWLMNGVGPYTIVNNTLQGGTENFLTGGDLPYIRSTGTISASPAPTTTACRIVITNGGDAPLVGQTIALSTLNGGLPWREHPSALTVTTVAADTYDLTYAAIGNVPIAGGDARFGVIPSDITFTDNWVVKDASQVGVKILPMPTDVSAVAGTGGTLEAGTFTYRVHARMACQGITITSDATTAATVVVAATGKIDVSWTASAGAESYRVYVQHPSGTWYYKTVTGATSTSYTAQGTAGTVSSGNRWAVKCLFELKCGINVTVERNILENSWLGAGSGGVFWLKSANQSSGSYGGAFMETTNVTVRNNIGRNAAHFATFAIDNESNDNGRRPKPGKNWLIQQNLCYSLGIEPWKQGVSVYAINWGNGGDDIDMDHNTILHGAYGACALNLSTSDAQLINHPRYCNNIMYRHSYGFRGQNVEYYSGEGTPALNAYSGTTFTWTNNVLADASAGTYPTGGNLFPTTATLQSTYFTNYAAQDFTLAPGSPALGAGTSGSNIGADAETILTLTANVISGLLEPPDLPVIVTTELADGTVGTVYAQTIAATGGVNPLTFAVTSGTLPTGLTLNATSGAITGTPTVVGIASVTVTVTDVNSATDAQAFTIDIEAAPVPVATRFYFPSTGTPPITPLFGPGWDFGSAATKRPLVSVKVVSAKANLAFVSAALSPEFRAHSMYVSDPLGAQTITGTCKGVISCFENNAAFAGTVALRVRIVDATGTHKAHLTNGGSQVPVASEDTSTTPPELTTNASPGHARRFMDSTGATDLPITEVTTASGDCLVVELGIRNATTSTSTSGTIRTGDDNASDLAYADGAHADEDPWIEFTHEFLPVEVGPAPGTSAAGALYVTGYLFTFSG